MRELKFRHYNLRDKEMMHSENDYCLEAYFENKYYDHTPDEQFTGLKDRNGVDIYEGDIIDIQEVGKRIVSYDERDGMYVFKGWAALHYYNCSEWKVIGNIHQHKHLLEE